MSGYDALMALSDEDLAFMDDDEFNARLAACRKPIPFIDVDDDLIDAFFNAKEEGAEMSCHTCGKTFELEQEGGYADGHHFCSDGCAHEHVFGKEER